MAQASSPTKPAPVEAPVEAPPVVCPMPTKPAPTESPDDLVLVLFDSKRVPELNTDRLGVTLTREGVFANGTTQALAEVFYLNQGITEVPREVWDEVVRLGAFRSTIKKALDLGSLALMGDWSTMGVRDKIEAINLCLDDTTIKRLTIWRDDISNTPAIDEELNKKINELTGLSPDQFEAMRRQLSGSK